MTAPSSDTPSSREHGRNLATDSLLQAVYAPQSSQAGERALAQIQREAKLVLWRPALAAAALLLIGLFIIIGGPESYPPLVNNSTLQEVSSPVAGARKFITTDQPAQLVLGDYCRIDVSKDAIVYVIDGKPYHEAIALAQGKVACDIDSSKGTFKVHTIYGSVAVTGTTFTVGLSAENPQGMHVTVTEGSVRVTDNNREETLRAGEEVFFTERNNTMNKSKVVASLLTGALVVGGITAAGDVNANDAKQSFDVKFELPIGKTTPAKDATTSEDKKTQSDNKTSQDGKQSFDVNLKFDTKK